MTSPETSSKKTKTTNFGSLAIPDNLLRKAKLISALDGTSRNLVLINAIIIGIEQLSENLEARVATYLAGEGPDTEDSEEAEEAQ